LPEARKKAPKATEVTKSAEKSILDRRDTAVPVEWSDEEEDDADDEFQELEEHILSNLSLKNY
jgi:hypothetical protein